MLKRQIAHFIATHERLTVLCIGAVLVAGSISASDANPLPCNFFCRSWLGSDEHPAGSSPQASAAAHTEPQQAPPSLDTYAAPPGQDQIESGPAQQSMPIPRHRKVGDTRQRSPRLSKSQPHPPSATASSATSSSPVVPSRVDAAKKVGAMPPAPVDDGRPVPPQPPGVPAATVTAPAADPPSAAAGEGIGVAPPVATSDHPPPTVAAESPDAESSASSPAAGPLPSPRTSPTTQDAPRPSDDRATSAFNAAPPSPPIPTPDADDATEQTERLRILPAIDTADVTASIPRVPDPGRLHDHAPVLVAMIKIALPRQSSIASEDFHPTSTDGLLVAAEIGLETEMLRTSETDATYASCIAAHLDTLAASGTGSDALTPDSLARHVAQACGVPQPSRRGAAKSNFLYLSLRRYQQLLAQMHTDGEPIVQRVIATQLALRKSSDHHVFACLEQGYLGGSDGGTGQPLVFRLLMSSIDSHGERNDAVAGLIVSSMASYCADEEFGLAARKS